MDDVPVKVAVRVKPGARRAFVGGRWDGPGGPALLVAVTAPAVDGKATAAAIRAVAKAFEVRSRDVTLLSGERSRDKVLDIRSAVIDAELQERLAGLLGGGSSLTRD